MAWLSLIGISIFTLYVLISILAFGILPSLSHTYYYWKNRNNGVKWPFTLALVSTALLLLAPMISLGEGSYLQFTGFIVPASLIFVAVAPEFANTLTIDSKLHPIAAYVCATGAILWEYFIAERLDFLLGFLILNAIFALLSRTVKRCYIFWFEMTCFYSIFACLIKIYFF